jgi:hypothetical protein
MTYRTKIFISYARKDGRDLAVCLHHDLTTVGYSTWLDSSEIAGGASWAQAIEQAIERCDVALALLSAGSFGSEICRANLGLDRVRAGKSGAPARGGRPGAGPPSRSLRHPRAPSSP